MLRRCSGGRCGRCWSLANVSRHADQMTSGPKSRPSIAKEINEWPMASPNSTRMKMVVKTGGSSSCPSSPPERAKLSPDRPGPPLQRRPPLQRARAIGGRACKMETPQQLGRQVDRIKPFRMAGSGRSALAGGQQDGGLARRVQAEHRGVPCGGHQLRDCGRDDAELAFGPHLTAAGQASFPESGRCRDRRRKAR